MQIRGQRNVERVESTNKQERATPIGLAYHKYASLRPAAPASLPPIYSLSHALAVSGLSDHTSFIDVHGPLEHSGAAVLEDDEADADSSLDVTDTLF